MRFKSGHSFSVVSLNKLLNNKYEDHSPLDFHQIEFFVFILYANGTENHIIDFKDYACKKGTLLAIRKGQIHKFSATDLDGFILVFNYEFLGSFFTESEAQKSLLLFNDFLFDSKIQLNKKNFQELFSIAKEIKEEWQNVDDNLSPSIVRSLLQVFINKLYRIKSSSQEKVSDHQNLTEFIQFQTKIEESYAQSLKVKDYAQWLGIHSKTLNNITQMVVKKTAKEFIDEICIKNIKIALVNTQLSIKEIGFNSGFEENTNFNNYFKNRVGITPLEFRKKRF
ncbi:MAG: helix-turn-helix transcriptional regulator [Bacteroidia bacterium]